MHIHTSQITKQLAKHFPAKVSDAIFGDVHTIHVYICVYAWGAFSHQIHSLHFHQEMWCLFSDASVCSYPILNNQYEHLEHEWYVYTYCLCYIQYMHESEKCLDTSCRLQKVMEVINPGTRNIPQAFGGLEPNTLSSLGRRFCHYIYIYIYRATRIQLDAFLACLCNMQL